MASSSARPPNAPSRLATIRCMNTRDLEMLGDCPDVEQRHVRVERPERLRAAAARWRPDRRAVFTCRTVSAPVPLLHRQVHERTRRFGDVAVFAVARDADDLDRPLADADASADRIASGEVAARQRFVDDRRRPAVPAVSRSVNSRPATRRNAHRLQIVGADAVVVERDLLVRRRRVAVDRGAEVAAAAESERHARGEAGGVDAGQLAHAREQRRGRTRGRARRRSRQAADRSTRSSPLRGREPGSIDCAFRSVRRNSPAETSRTSESATCATTSAWRSRARRGDAVTAPADSFSAAPTDDVEPCSAGTRPKATTLTAVTPAANSSTAAIERRVRSRSAAAPAGRTAARDPWSSRRSRCRRCRRRPRAACSR